MTEFEIDTMEALIDELEAERDLLRETLVKVGARLRAIAITSQTYEILELVDGALSEVDNG